jgi:pimeloyl-ACP methyl ester carboxylesterase
MRTRIIALALAFGLAQTAAAHAEPTWVEGDWIGGFEGRDGSVFISAHFTADGERVNGHLDIPTRGEVHVPMDHVDAGEGGLSFEVAGVGANLLFDGRRKAAGRVSGSVRQASASTRFELIKLAPLSPEVVDAVVGNYEIEPGRVVLVTRGPNGLLYLDDRAGRFGSLFPVDGRTLVAGPSVVAGYPVDLTVTFDRGAGGAVDALVWERKGETPRRAVRRVYYRSEPIAFYNGAVRLSGTLVTPNGPGPHPAVVMIHGSGPATRDSLRPWADMYARRGVAVLIHDKRGTGASTGNWARASFGDLAGDALAGRAFLRSRPEINGRQIGLHGMSLGGWIAPLAASREPDVAFVIVESAPVLSPRDHERLRVEQQLRADGFTVELVAHATAFMDQKFEVARTGDGWDRLTTGMARGAREGWLTYVNAPTSLESLQWNWQHVLSYDPLPALERLQCPVLVLYGGLDRIVPATHSSNRMEKILRGAGNRDATVRVFKTANHAFLEAVTGGKREAPSLRGFVSGYFDTHVDWLTGRVDIPARLPSVTETTATGVAPVEPSVDMARLAPRLLR